MKDMIQTTGSTLSIPIRKSYSKLGKQAASDKESKTGKRETSKQSRYQSRQGNASKLENLNLTLQGLASTHNMQQTTKASTKASKAQLNKTDVSTKNRITSGGLKNI